MTLQVLAGLNVALLRLLQRPGSPADDPSAIFVDFANLTLFVVPNY